MINTADSSITADSLLTADGATPRDFTGVVDPIDRYADQLAALLPTGLAWPRSPDSTLQKLLAAWSTELALVDARANELIREANPTESQALLADWARITGIPDKCLAEDSVVDTRAAVLAKLTSVVIPTPAYFIGLAAAIGYTVTVTEFWISTVDDNVDAPMLTEAWAHAWQINTVLNGGVSPFTVDDGVDIPLESWSNNAALECVINRAKPAHTTVIFAYT